MNSDARNLCWPTFRIGEALELLGRRAGFRPKAGVATNSPGWLEQASRESLAEWVDTVAASMSMDVVLTNSPYGDVEAMLRRCAPAILRLELAEDQDFLVVLRRRGSRLVVLTPDLATRRIPIRQVRDLLCAPLEARLDAEVDRLLNDAEIQGSRRSKIRCSIFRERLAATPIELGWILRYRPSRGFADQARDSGVRSRLFGFLTAHTAEYLITIASWWIIGKGALDGRLDFGWLIAWVLLLLTRIPLRLSAAWLQGQVAIRAAAVLKRRLLAGSLRISPDDVRNQGTGQLLGRVIESEALESLALNGALTGIVSLVEIVVSAAILLLAANSLLLCLALLAWTAILAWLTFRYTRHRARWTEMRLDLTNELVERMAGHRTRLAQEPLKNWHETEDDNLERYVHVCRKLDHSLVPLSATVPRGWIVTALLCIAYTFISGATTATALAIAFGGILLAEGALRRLTASLAYISGAIVAWEQVKPVYDAAAAEEAVSLAEIATYACEPSSVNRLEVRNVSYSHRGRADKALDRCSLRLAPGDKVLVEGASGGGKSTLASLLAGIRRPDSGLITIDGLDYETLGSRAWRRAVAAAPQFHENHIFSNTLAFNLLVGRRWPPQPDDFEEAEALCRELGLGDLLDRMPAGLSQTVGETGWQLSYGEQCRIFVARALLQGAPVVVLDESFGSLDPETLEIAIVAAKRHALTLVVIAHP